MTTAGGSHASGRRVQADTYSLYLQGRHAWHQLSPQALRRSIGCFERAIERESSYAPAYVGIADAYYFLGLFESLAPDEAYAKGAPNARRALSLDSGLAEAHAAVANFKFSYEWDWSGADTEYQAAIRLNPNASIIRWHYALCLGNLGRLDEALDQLTVARSLDPLWVAPHQSLGYFSFAADRFDESPSHRVARQLDPDYPLALITAGGSSSTSAEPTQRSILRVVR